MKVLVTGGTGFVGRHLVRALIEKGCAVKMLARESSNAEEFEKLNVEILHGDVTNKNSLPGITDDTDVVYHLAAQVGEWGIPESQFDAVNVQGTRNLLGESVRAGVKHFVFCSTPGVLGKGYAHAPETLPYNPPYVYERTKCDAEKTVLEFHHSQHLPVTIIRPDFVYGPGDLRRLPLYRAIRDRRFYIIGNGRTLLHPTYVDDVIQGFHLVAKNSVPYGEIYNIAGPHPVTVQEFVETIARVFKVHPPRIKIPKFLALVAAQVCESLSGISGKEPFISRSRIEFLTNSHGSDVSKAQTRLGYQAGFQLEEGMRRTIDWYHEHRLL
jgi:UDP-glucose 4-epimerase